MHEPISYIADMYESVCAYMKSPTQNQIYMKTTYFLIVRAPEPPEVESAMHISLYMRCIIINYLVYGNEFVLYIDTWFQCPSLSLTVVCNSSCPFVPCSIAKCPRLPTAECQNDYCNGCNHKYYLNGSDVSALCGKTSPGIIWMSTPHLFCL